MQEQLAALLTEHATIEGQLADPSLHADQARARDLGRRYAELTPLATLASRLATTDADLQAARELAAEDVGFAAEAETLEQASAQLGEELATALRAALVPRDPLDDKDVILEIKAGEGGEESALFAGDLLRMYLRLAERRGWRTELLDATESDLGGYKDVSVSVGARTGGAWSALKFEGGVHRVQRVPATESQGRLHTSAAGVLVLPEAEEVEIALDPADLRVDVFRSTGPGGQSVNTTDSAVRITHLPTGTVVSCQNEKSQLQNKEAALRILRARLLAAAQEEAAAAASAARAAQVRTVDRSERIRTYNFKENRVSDHRINYTAYNLDAVLDGDLDTLLAALAEADGVDRLAGGEWAVSTRPRASRDAAGPAERVALATGVLARAGVASARHDAELLAAHALGVPRTALAAAGRAPGEDFDVLVARRAQREPLQHLLGSAPFRYLELAVGPGVFVPRPESELVVEPVLGALDRWSAAEQVGHDRWQGTVVDLCAGCGALGLAVATERPGTEVHLVERSPAAYRWLASNVTATAGSLPPPPRGYLADALGVTQPDGVLAGLTGRVDAVVSNPPYLPEGLRPGLEPEVRDWDPPEALFAGDDGLSLVRQLVSVISRLLRPGGLMSMEHGEDQQKAVLALLGAPSWRAAQGHCDLAGRPRYVTAVRSRG